VSVKLKWTQTDMILRNELQVDRFVNDFPIYSGLIKNHRLSGRGSLILSNEGVERVKRYFDVSITLHNYGELFDDLRKMGKSSMEHRRGLVCGFMSPEFHGSKDFYIALTAYDNKSIIPTSTLVHELGHLVEEQVRLDTDESTTSAYNYARKALLLNGMGVAEEHELHLLSNEWVAWINSIWISKMLDIDIRHSILGMIIDETGWIGSHNNTVTRSLTSLMQCIESTHTVRHRLLTAETVSVRCMLINEMSSRFFYLASRYKLPGLNI